MYIIYSQYPLPHVCRRMIMGGIEYLCWTEFIPKTKHARKHWTHVCIICLSVGVCVCLCVEEWLWEELNVWTEYGLYIQKSKHARKNWMHVCIICIRVCVFEYVRVFMCVCVCIRIYIGMYTYEYVHEVMCIYTVYTNIHLDVYL